MAAIYILVFAATSQASQLSLGSAGGFNAFIFSNFSETNTDAQGKVAVGGNFSPAGNGSFTVAGTSTDPAGVYDLVVGGNFNNAYTQLGGGDAYVGGNMTWTDPSLPHNAYVAGNFTNSSGGGSVGGTIFYGGSFSSGDALSNVHEAVGNIVAPIDFAGAQTNLESVSASLAGDQANGTVNHSYSTYTLTGADPNLNVFDMTDSSYQSATININAPSTSTVVINVAGSAVSFANGSINLNGVLAGNVIFNFDTASTLSLSGIAFNGTILAPTANFSGTWGNINGELIANSAAGTTQLNNVVFTGSLGSGGPDPDVSSTPEPSTWIMLAGGFLFLVGLFGKRQKSSR
jgi:choice-of-anchor A domain-containing protein